MFLGDAEKTSFSHGWEPQNLLYFGTTPRPCLYYRLALSWN
jgi:hypothetical protein